MPALLRGGQLERQVETRPVRHEARARSRGGPEAPRQRLGPVCPAHDDARGRLANSCGVTACARARSGDYG